MAAGDDPEPQEPLIRRWFSHTSRILLAAWWTTTRLAIVALIVLLLLPLKSAIFDRGLVIGEFTVPEELQKNGVTSAVVGRLLFDRISEMQRVATNNTAFEDTRLGATAFAAGEKATNLVDVKLPGADISLVSLVSQLRSLLHIKDTKIVGEIVISHKDHESKFVLRAHSTGGILWVENVDGLDIDSLVDQIAVLLVQRFDPLIAGFYHLRVPGKGGTDNIAQAIGIAEGFHSDDENRQSWALMLRGLAYSEKNDPSNAQASLCAAIDRDPSFTPAWRVLAGMLRGQGYGTKAYDLALRLVHSRPDEPEGYRQLGNLRQDCMAGEGQAEQAKRFFETAIEIGARRGSEHVDYLSHLDYAKFLYTWYDPGKKDNSSPPRAAASSKPDYLEAATDQLKQAQKIAPNEASVSALLATVLGYPRLDETRDERELRLLVAELEANFALSQDSGDPFLSTVMGELLTDHGVEAHKYRSTEKFKKAKDLFADARRSAVQSEGLYEALYARALAGTGDFAAADNVLKPFEQRSTTARKRPYYHLEWVRGEMLYNQGRLHEALVRLKRAESIRTCGPRSNLVHELIGIIEQELAKEQIARRAEPPTTSAELPRLDWQYAWWRREGKSVSDPQPACPGWKALTGDEAVPPSVGNGPWQRIFGRWAS